MKEKRLDSIREYINLKSSVSLEELKNKYEISMNTVRRDIEILLKEGSVKKVYGGVVSKPNEPVKALRAYEKRENLNNQGKEIIGEKAASYIEDNDTIFIDSGTTTLKIISYIKNKKNLTVITHSLPTINMLYRIDNIKVIILPGVLFRETASFVGNISGDFLKPFNIKKAFMSCNGISETRQITNASYEEYEIKKNIIGKSEQVFLLADKEKFGNGGVMTFAEFSDIDVLVTDFQMDEKYSKLFSKTKIDNT